MDSPEKVREELHAFSEGADALFVEAPAEPTTIRTILRALVRVPVYLVGILVLFLFVQGPLFVAFNREVLPTEQVVAAQLSEQAELPLHSIDDSLYTRFSEANAVSSFVNWLFVGLFVLSGPLNVVATVLVVLVGGLLPQFVRLAGYRRLAIALLVGGPLGVVGLGVAGNLSLWFLVGSFVVALLALKASIGPRSDAMLDRVERITADEGYDDAVIVTGKAHLCGMVTAAWNREFSTPRVYVPTWREEGTVQTDFEAADLPGEPLGTDEKMGRRPVAAGTERAALPRRALATLFDAVAVLALGAVSYLLVGRFTAPVAVSGSDLSLAPLSAVCVALSYYIITEGSLGTSPGKDIVGLAVADADGGPPTAAQIVVRNLLRPVDVASGALVALGSDRGQRLGDHAAGTVVGRTAAPEEPTADTSADWRRVPQGPVVTSDSVQTRRAMAAVYDLGVVFVITVVAVVMPAVNVAYRFGVPESALDGLWGLVILAPFLPTLVVYHVVSEFRFATTPGKVLAGKLVVIDADGGSLSPRQALVRNLVRLPDVVLAYLPGLAAMGLSDRQQTVGDRIAGTVVGRRPAATDEASVQDHATRGTPESTSEGSVT